MGHLLHTKQYPLDQHIIMCVSHLQELWLTLSLFVTHVIFVIQVDEFIISINLSNQMHVLPPGPDYCKICKP